MYVGIRAIDGQDKARSAYLSSSLAAAASSDNGDVPLRGEAEDECGKETEGPGGLIDFGC